MAYWKIGQMVRKPEPKKMEARASEIRNLVRRKQ
jgi:hypothetical protein